MKKMYQAPELCINLMANEDIMSVSTNELSLFNNNDPAKATGDVISMW